MLDMTVPIPVQRMPQYKEFIYESGVVDQLIKIEQLDTTRLHYQPIYHEQGIRGATTECYVREQVGELLLKAVALLPPNYSFLVYDAWRPFEVQYALYEQYYKAYVAKHPEQDEEAVKAGVKQFVSEPMKDAERPFVHATGGAVDLTILDENGKALDMGTGFDAFCEEAHTAYFELHEQNDVVRDNRRMLFSIMTSVGFTNLPSEWWHYDYGDAFWSDYTGERIKYRGVLE